MIKKMKLSKPHNLFWFGIKIVIALCFLYCLVAYLKIQSQVKLPFLFSTSHASRFFNYGNSERTPKIAFLFLTGRHLPLDFLWDSFFKNVDAANFSIFIHSLPGFVFDETTTKSAFFYGQQLNYSIQVKWGEPSMIEAEKLLLVAALRDPANQRFVLLSDSCIPLHKFSYIYSYLMASPKSYVDSFIDVKDNRYSPQMLPIIPKDKWRKGSQWISLVRRHAEMLADDYIVLSVFKKFCKRWPPINIYNNQRQILQTSDQLQNFLPSGSSKIEKHRNCIPDEHYVQTLFAMNGLEDELERRSLTFTMWNQFGMGGQSPWHPFTFDYADVTPQKIKEIKVIDHVFNPFENQREWCQVDNLTTSCFLFARKFTYRAALRLLTQDLIGLRDPIVLPLTTNYAAINSSASTEKA